AVVDPCGADGGLRDLDGSSQGAGESAADAARGCRGVCLLQGLRELAEEKVMGSREQLIERSIPFLREVKDMTPSAAMERWLNEAYGEDSAVYRDLARLIKMGVEEGWAANQEVEGPNYRRSRILEPVPETFQFSITAV